jgi:hypothetical protein
VKGRRDRPLTDLEFTLDEILYDPFQSNPNNKVLEVFRAGPFNVPLRFNFPSEKGMALTIFARPSAF